MRRFSSSGVKGILINRPNDLPRRPDYFRTGDPAVVIEGVVAHHLEMLGVVRRRRIGIRLVESVGYAHPFHRPSRDAVHHGGSWDARDLEDG